MHTINLVEYIRHGMILKNLAENNNYDAIIYEQLDTKLELPDNLTIHTLDTTNPSSINAQLMAYADSYENILIVLDALHFHHIIPFVHACHLKKHQEGRITLINLGTGISGLSTKGTPELHDIGLAMEYAIPTFEPFDFVSCFSMLQNDVYPLQYIRIPQVDYPGNLHTEISRKPTQHVIDMTSGGLSGDHATLLCHGAHITSCIQAHTLVKEQKKHYDLFLLAQYILPIDNEQLLASIEKTKKLILVLDQNQTTSYQTYIQARLFTQGIHDIATVSFITPNHETLHISPTTSVYEQANMSPEGIAEHIGHI